MASIRKQTRTGPPGEPGTFFFSVLLLPFALDLPPHERRAKASQINDKTKKVVFVVR